MDTVIYHNPKCSKSRATLALLREHGIEPEIVEYLKTPPDALMLAEILRRLGIGPRDLMRKRESVYRERNLSDPGLDDSALIAAMVADPILIERPIVLHGGRARVGRPPESVLEILGCRRVFRAGGRAAAARASSRSRSRIVAWTVACFDPIG